MKKLNKKGFTIVELVIVIAVIAILAAVMIPTFSGMVEKAEESNALSTAKNAYTSILYSVEDGDIAVDGKIDAYIKVDNYYFSVDGGELKMVVAPADGILSDTAVDTEAWEKATNIEDLPSNVTAYLYSAAVADEDA